MADDNIAGGTRRCQETRDDWKRNQVVDVMVTDGAGRGLTAIVVVKFVDVKQAPVRLALITSSRGDDTGI